MIVITLGLIFYLFVVLVGTAAELILTMNNIRHLKRHGHAVPEPFKGYIDEDRLTRITDYTVETERFDMVATVIGVCCLLIVILSGWLPSFVEWLEGYDWGVVWSGLVFFALVGTVLTLFSMPFHYYKTFVIEQKYGFNTSSLQTWLIDMAKGLVLGAVIGGALLLAVLGLVEHGGTLWWLWAWCVFFSFQLLLLLIYPTLIAPWFNKFSPLDDEALEEKVTQLMERGGLSVKGVFKMDAGKRSRHTNAYFTGLGKTKRIVLFDTLVTAHTHDEILSILAHEVGHWRKGHVAKNVVLVGVFSLAVFFVASLSLNWKPFYSVFGFEQEVSYAGLFLLALWWGAISPFFEPVGNWLSRRFERQADAFAVGLTNKSADLKNALRRLAADNLSNLYPHPLYARVYYSHPPLLERILYLDKVSDGRSRTE